MPLQEPECYIPLEWVCCLLVATVLISVIENHRFARWIFFNHLRRTLKRSHLNR